jgi:hypothetical protein
MVCSRTLFVWETFETDLYHLFLFMLCMNESLICLVDYIYRIMIK